MTDGLEPELLASLLQIVTAVSEYLQIAAVPAAVMELVTVVHCSDVMDCSQQVLSLATASCIGGFGGDPRARVVHGFGDVDVRRPLEAT